MRQTLLTPRIARHEGADILAGMRGEGSGDLDHFDLVVIGSGPAGEKGAAQAAYHGHSVAVVERRSRAGGAAIAVSGVPVKALRDTAMYLTGWARRDVYGVGISLAPDLLMNRLRARLTDVVTTMTAAVHENLKRHSVEFVHGEARLGPERTVIVRDDEGAERRSHQRAIPRHVWRRRNHSGIQSMGIQLMITRDVGCRRDDRLQGQSSTRIVANHIGRRGHHIGSQIGIMPR